MADAVGKVIGVEVVPQAIDDAKENAKRAGIENAELYCGDAGEIAAKFAAEGSKPDLIVLDPPRKRAAMHRRSMPACKCLPRALS